MSISSQHHSFDIALAARYGMECAVIIHHFQHWIRINQVSKRNIREGRCWSYQSRKQIQLHLPYLTYDEIRRICEKLVTLGVLISKNFNKNPIDKTLWYAFVDEKAFGVDLEYSRNVYERQNCPSKGRIATRKANSPHQYQILKHTNTKTTDRDIKESPLRGQKKKSAPPPPPPATGPYGNRFEGKVKITKEARDRLIADFGGMESLIDEYARRLYEHDKINPGYLDKKRHHDLIIARWIAQDLGKSEKKESGVPATQGLNDIQLANWKENYELVQRLIADEPNTFGGLNFYYKAHLLKDSRQPNFSVQALMDHQSFCKLLDKQYNGCIEETIFGHKRGDWGDVD